MVQGEINNIHAIKSYGSPRPSERNYTYESLIGAQMTAPLGGSPSRVLRDKTDSSLDSEVGNRGRGSCLDAYNLNLNAEKYKLKELFNVDVDKICPTTGRILDFCKNK